MPLPFAHQTDADFVPRAEVESVEELVHRLRLRFRDRNSTTDPREEEETVENLRLLICTRSLQGWSDEDLLAELIGIGLVEDYAWDLIGFTHGAGRPGFVPQTPLLSPRGYGGTFWIRYGSPAMPSFPFRTRHRLQQAKRLAGLAGDDPEAFKEFQPVPVIPSTPGRGSRILTLLVVLATLTVIVGVSLPSIVWGLRRIASFIP